MTIKEVYIDNQFIEEQTVRAKVIFENVKNYIDGKDVLDLGLGDMICFSYFKNFPQTYDVIDSSEEIIEEAKRRIDTPRENIHSNNIQINFYCSLFEDFETTKKYDCIIMANILEHVENPEFILMKYKKFLKQQGRVFVEVPNSNVLNRLIAVKAGMLESTSHLTKTDILVGHKRIFSIDTITSLVEKCGYHVLNTIGTFLKPITSAQMKQIGFSQKIYTALGILGNMYPDLSNTILLELELLD